MQLAELQGKSIGTLHQRASAAHCQDSPAGAKGHIFIPLYQPEYNTASTRGFYYIFTYHVSIWAKSGTVTGLKDSTNNLQKYFKIQTS